MESSSIASGLEPRPQELQRAKKTFSEVVQQRLKNSSELVSASTTQLLCSCSALPQTGTCHRSRSSRCCKLRLLIDLLAALRAYDNNVQKVVEQLRTWANPNSATNDGKHALHRALAQGHAAVARQLLTYKADI